MSMKNNFFSGDLNIDNYKHENKIEVFCIFKYKITKYVFQIIIFLTYTYFKCKFKYENSTTIQI